MHRPLLALLVITALAVAPREAHAADSADPTIGSRNKPDRLEWFRDQGFGLFIHWSVDSQLGAVISHSMVGASEDYLDRYIRELPSTFNPRKFAPQDWAALARLAGIRYVVFTTKHHNGFCMFDTRTTSFGIMQTPFRRDATAEILDAFRAQGIAPGVYFSPDDFWWLHQQRITLQRQTAEVQPRANPGLMAHAQAQVRELFTRYGRIDLAFFDGEAEGLRDVAWDLQPDVVVTRGAMPTPEQHIPGAPLDTAWEACLTMGTQWQYKPTNERYKSGRDCIGLLIETRAKGGNLLLNVGPKPDGELPIEQEERLREIALWMFVNGECIHGVRPWIVTNEGDFWFTRKKDTDTLYVIVKEPDRWPYGAWKEIVLHSVRATEATEVSVLGQNDRVLEYRPDVVPRSTWTQQPDGLHLRAMRAQRLYNDRTWPNPVVLKLTHVAPALVPPRVETVEVTWDAAARVARCVADLISTGDASAAELSVEYRDITGLDANERTHGWIALPARTAASPQRESFAVEGLSSRRTYEFRVVARHPRLAMYGREIVLTIP
jgi:alpha-L-fucosidase